MNFISYIILSTIIGIITYFIIKDREEVNYYETKEYKEILRNLNKKNNKRIKKQQKNKEIKPKIKNKFYYGNDWKKKKGSDYEYYIMQYYTNEGYKIYPQGHLKGYDDKGIDLIAHKGKETILIQCKNWKYRAELKNITKFYNDCKEYEKHKTKFLKGRYIRKVFVISNEIQNKEINNFLEKINHEIEFYNLPFFE